LAIITGPIRRMPETGEKAGANDAFLLAKPRNVPACPVVLPLKAGRNLGACCPNHYFAMLFEGMGGGNV